MKRMVAEAVELGRNSSGVPLSWTHFILIAIYKISMSVIYTLQKQGWQFAQSHSWIVEKAGNESWHPDSRIKRKKSWHWAAEKLILPLNHQTVVPGPGHGIFFIFALFTRAQEGWLCRTGIASKSQASNHNHKFAGEATSTLFCITDALDI